MRQRRGPWADEITESGWLGVWAAGLEPNAVCGFGDMEETEGFDHENAAFIAHAREDIPWLIAELRATSAVCRAALDLAGRRTDRISKSV